MLMQKYAQIKMRSTAERLHEMRANLPSILQTIYLEDKVRLREDVEDQRAVYQAFEHRKGDSHYYQLLERQKKRKQ